MGLGGFDKEKKKWQMHKWGEGRNCSKNWTGEKECKSIGKYRFFGSIADGQQTHKLLVICYDLLYGWKSV